MPATITKSTAATKAAQNTTARRSGKPAAPKATTTKTTTKKDTVPATTAKKTTTRKPAAKKTAATTKTSSVEATMSLTRMPTGKGGVRFDVAEKEGAVTTTTYLAQDAWKALGEPESIVVTIAAAK